VKKLLIVFSFFGLTVCHVLCVFALGAYVGMHFFAAPSVAAQDLQGTYKFIKEKHVTTDVSDSELYYAAAIGMVERLGDKHSRFIAPVAAKIERENETGAVTGIGAKLEFTNGIVTVFEPIDGSPAAAAGLRRGDIIIAVNGMPTAGKTSNETIALIRGEEDTDVTLNIRRTGVKDAFDIRIIRTKFDVPSVEWHALTENGKTLMVVAITGFHEDTGDLFRKASDEALRIGASGLILDLRDDRGGIMAKAGEVVCQWVSDRPFAIVKYKDGEPHPQTCSLLHGAPLAGMPTVVLVNGGSASASEITAGALQDFGKARIIGETTYGKGCGQDIKDFPDGARLVLVSFLWYTPNGRSIHGTGITPDEVAKNDPADVANGRDAQLERAKAYLLTRR
jgi:carboxyl-terminal processing protease